MKATSQEFAATVKDSHHVVTRADLLIGGNVAEAFEITEGQVEIDSSNHHQGKMKVTLRDETLVPSQATDLFAPFGNEIQLHRGIRLGDGTEEMVPLGIYGIKKSKVQDSGEALSIKLEGFDRSKRLARARFQDTYHKAHNNVTGEVIEEIVQQQDPLAEFAGDITTQLPDQSAAVEAEPGEDPWAVCQELARADGANLYYDGNGKIDVKWMPEETTGSVHWVFEEGEDGMILSIDKEQDNDATYNHVIVTGETPGCDCPPVTAETWDNDPTSPTYRYGTFGDIVYFYHSPLIHTESQAQAVAELTLREVLGGEEKVQFQAICHPALEPFDLVQITRDRMSLNKVGIIEKVSIPMVGFRGMYIKLREYRTEIEIPEGPEEPGE